MELLLCRIEGQQALTGDLPMIMKRTLVFLSLSLLLAIATLAQNLSFGRATQQKACSHTQGAQSPGHDDCTKK